MFDGPIDWGTIGIAVLVLLAIDVVGTFVLAALFGSAASGRSSEDTSFTSRVTEYIGDMYNRYTETEINSCNTNGSSILGLKLRACGWCILPNPDILTTHRGLIPVLGGLEHCDCIVY